MSLISSCISHISNFVSPSLPSLPQEVIVNIFSCVHPYKIKNWIIVSKEFYKLAIEKIQTLAKECTINKDLTSTPELRERLRNLPRDEFSFYNLTHTDPTLTILIFLKGHDVMDVNNCSL